MNENLKPIRLNDINLGLPLAWSIFDKFGRLLLREGSLVESQKQLESLSENGMFRERRDEPVRKPVESKEGVTSKSSAVEANEDLLSLKLSIGDSIQLQDFSSDKQRFFVKLIGFMNKKSVLVSHPTYNDKLSFIKEGSGFLVRGFAGTKTYEFNSNVISVSLSPYPYLHMAFPAQVKTINMRGAVRVKFRLVCSIESLATGKKTPAIIEDMSISGARIHASEPFGKVGDAITVGMRMQVDGENQVFQVSAMLRNVRADTDSQTNKSIVMHGIEFVQTVSMDLLVLQNVIYKSMLES